jgi:hypothetical protein
MNSIGGRKSPMGLGTLAEKIIHAGLNVTPMPAKVRAAIKGCAGCRRRKNAMNRFVPNVNPFG